MDEINKNESVQIQELSEYENPFDYLCTKIFMEVPWTVSFKRIKFEGLSNSISKFIDDTEEIRLFWITYNFAQKRKSMPSDEQMNYFIDNYGINKSYQTNYNIPEIPNHLTIKMVRYLVKKPHLIYTWFLSNKHILLVPLYFKMLCDTIE